MAGQGLGVGVQTAPCIADPPPMQLLEVAFMHLQGGLDGDMGGGCPPLLSPLLASPLF